MARQLGCACRPSHWPWPPAIVQGCSWLPSMCLAWAITPRAPSADRLCASERREQKTRWHSLKPPGQYGCSAVKSGQAAAWLPSHCPRFMPCTRCAQTNRPLSVRRQCLAFLRQPELSAPVGGRAPGLRSEGSWLAAELLCAGLEPGVLDRCAGWVGLSPAQPTPGHFPPRGPVCLCVFVCGLVNSHNNKRVPAAQTPRRGTSRLDSRARVHPRPPAHPRRLRSRPSRACQGSRRAR